MKLKQLATMLAVVSASTAFAQVATPASSVTIYGRIDAGVAHIWGNGPSRTLMDHYHTSRLGFRGVEDLGGGNSSIFKMESRFLGKNGAQQDAATYFNDETYVGLTNKDWGTLKLGRIYSPFYLAVAGRIDPFNGDGIGSMTGLTSLGHNLSPGNPYDTAKKLANRDVRHSNAIDYASPTFKGFSAQAQHIVSEVRGQPSGRSFALRYDSPTLFAQTGYERKAFSRDAWTAHVGGGYVWGPAKISAGYTTGYYSDDEFARGNKARSGLLGLTYTMSPSVTILAAVARMEMDRQTLLDAAAGTGSNLTKYAIGVDYYLSKRTKLYAHYAHFSDNVSTIYVGNSQRAHIGIDHAF
jgi:general bacterial porin, GBP family